MQACQGHRLQWLVAVAHEDLRREHVVEGSSDRSFGWVFAAVFTLIAVWPSWHGEPPRWWAGGLAAVFALIVLLRPGLLAPLNRQWTKLGVLLAKVVSPVALGLLFYGVIAPVGIVMRLVGKDPLRLKFDRATDSYWIQREPPGPQPDSMSNQF